MVAFFPLIHPLLRRPWLLRILNKIPIVFVSSHQTQLGPLSKCLSLPTWPISSFSWFQLILIVEGIFTFLKQSFDSVTSLSKALSPAPNTCRIKPKPLARLEEPPLWIPPTPTSACSVDRLPHSLLNRASSDSLPASPMAQPGKNLSAV